MMKWIAWGLWGASFVTCVAAFLLDGPTIPWFVASVAGLALVRVEMLHEKLDKFHVIDEDDD